LRANHYRGKDAVAINIPKSGIWWIFLLQGMAGAALGLLLITEPGATTMTIVTFLGFYWLVMGLFALVRVFVDQSVLWVLSLLVAIVGILAGLSVIKHPLLAAIGLPTAIIVIIAIQGLVMGGLEIISAFRGAGVGSFILGTVYVVISLLLLAKPIAAAIAVPLVFGVLLLVQGAALIALALRARAGAPNHAGFPSA
jgi:uncharacterized membrane protein HdeD (DUF308 family)